MAAILNKSSLRGRLRYWKKRLRRALSPDGAPPVRAALKIVLV
jgi:hypothetical protein